MDTAGGVGVLSALAFSGLYLIVGKPEINVVFISLSACLSGFLVFNLPKASIIMGGVGSAMLGDFFAGASIHFYLINDHKVSLIIPIIILGVFVVDFTPTILIRAFRKKAFWRPHREYFYQKLIRSGWSHGKTICLEYSHTILNIIVVFTYFNANNQVQIICVILFP